MDYGHWITDIQFEPMDHFGFVYQITDLKTNMKYIGQKQFKNKIRRKPLKGKKRVRLDTRESNWKEYTGSSKALNLVIDQHINHIKSLNDKTIVNLDAILKKHFLFKILTLHSSKFLLSYAENQLIYIKNAMIENDYYNCFTNRLGNKKEF